MQQIVQRLTQARQVLALVAAVLLLLVVLAVLVEPFGIRSPVKLGYEALAYLAGAVWLAGR